MVITSRPRVDAGAISARELTRATRYTKQHRLNTQRYIDTATHARQSHGTLTAVALVLFPNAIYYQIAASEPFYTAAVGTAELPAAARRAF